MVKITTTQLKDTLNLLLTGVGIQRIVQNIQMETRKPGDKKYIFVYQTKNIINEKTYIGVHATNNINDGYIGCGIRSNASAKSQAKAGRKYPFISSVLKYGYENFKREILSFYDTEEEAYKEEEFLLSLNEIRSNKNYNASLGGSNPKRPSKMIEHSEEINLMFQKGFTYKKISEKFKTTKGSWIHLIKDSSIKKREKDSFNKDIEIEHLDGTKYTITTLNNLKKDLGLCPKVIFKIKTTGCSKNWYISGSEKLINKRKELDNKFITLNDKKIPLIEVYLKGVNNFSKENNINLSTLELKIKKSKRNG